ncbi:MAG: hypothetical protein H0V07_01270, partial [Propionibacteriales bacterium]|nr:hypothetical protein [Propionibacteriales bacterium]
MSSDLAKLTATFNDLARSFEPRGDRAGTLDRIVRAAVDAIPGVDHAGVSVRQGADDFTVLCAT